MCRPRRATSSIGQASLSKRRSYSKSLSSASPSQQPYRAFHIPRPLHDVVGIASLPTGHREIDPLPDRVRIKERQSSGREQPPLGESIVLRGANANSLDQQALPRAPRVIKADAPTPVAALKRHLSTAALAAAPHGDPRPIGGSDGRRIPPSSRAVWRAPNVLQTSSQLSLGGRLSAAAAHFSNSGPHPSRRSPGRLVRPGRARMTTHLWVAIFFQ